MAIERDWRAFIVPPTPVVGTGTDPLRKARLVAEPLERGFGVTLGNALRRVLLSSLQGAAVTAIQIDGVVSEFSRIDGMREDVVDIVLNIKQLALRMHAEGPKRMTLKATGPGPVTAGQIDLPADIEVLNPDHVICTLDDGASVRMELTVQNGKGYVASELNRPEDAPVGLIAVDALYSPVKRVAYRVEPTRQGQSLDYDKLILEVETNGAVSPVDAVAYASRILQEQLQIFITFDEPKKAVGKAEGGPDVPFNLALLKKVDELGLSARSVNCLKNDNIVYIGDLIQKTEGEMLRIPDFGRKSLNEIKKVLATKGLSLGMNVPTWPPKRVGAFPGFPRADSLAEETEDDLTTTAGAASLDPKATEPGPNNEVETKDWQEIARVCRHLTTQSRQILGEVRGFRADLDDFRSWAEHARSAG